MRLQPSPYLLLAASTLFWGGNFVFARAVSGEIPPITLNFWRWSSALIVLLPFTLAGLWHHRSVIAANWRILFLLAVTGVGAFHSFIYLALTSTTAINASLFMAAIPVIIPVFSWLLDKQLLSARLGLGILASLAGVLVIISRGDPAVLAALAFNVGDLWMLAAVPLWALYSVLLKRRPTGLPAKVFLACIICVGVVLLLPVYVWELMVLGGFEVNADNLVAIAYFGLFASVIAYVFWNRGVDQVGASRAGPFMHLVPVFATAMAIAFLGEALSLYHLMGIALIAVGLVLASARPRLRRAPET
jgi:drug/metabolite transporter (DMT)-like permease